MIEGKPVGDVLMSGTGLDTTLIGFFDWAKDRINTALSTSYTLVTTNASSVSIAGYESVQKNLLDFMSEIAAACNHLFYIDYDNDVINLVDMQKDNGTLTPDEFEFFDEFPRYQDPIKSTEYKWDQKSVTADDQGYPIIASQSQSQKVILDYPVGRQDVQIQVYHTTVTNIITLLTACSVSVQAPIANIELPFQTGIVPGLRITFTDDRFPTDVETEIRARTISFDPQSEKITVEGHAV